MFLVWLILFSLWSFLLFLLLSISLIDSTCVLFLFYLLGVNSDSLAFWLLFGFLDSDLFLWPFVLDLSVVWPALPLSDSIFLDLIIWILVFCMFGLPWWNIDCYIGMRRSEDFCILWLFWTLWLWSGLCLRQLDCWPWICHSGNLCPCELQSLCHLGHHLHLAPSPWKHQPALAHSILSSNGKGDLPSFTIIYPVIKLL